MFDAVKDSGKRQSFDTGSVRDTRDGKGRYDLLSPYTAQRDARHMENGAKKYGDRNWEKGQPFSRFLDSAERHLNALKKGLKDEDHASALRWNIGCIVHFQELIAAGRSDLAHLDDLPKGEMQQEGGVFYLGLNNVLYFSISHGNRPIFRSSCSLGSSRDWTPSVTYDTSHPIDPALVITHQAAMARRDYPADGIEGLRARYKELFPS